jgi:hypothetical protein
MARKNALRANRIPPSHTRRTLTIERLEDRLAPAVDPAVMLADINRVPAAIANGPIVAAGGKIFFTSEDGQRGADVGFGLGSSRS